MSAFFCGVDVGASATKLVLLDGGGAVLARALHPSGVDYAATAATCLEEAVRAAGLDSAPALTVATGYGRDNVDFAADTRTEIHCHGTGCYHEVGRRISIIDIGGQDNKIIHMDDAGRRREFKMNRKCAAGTGAFIEEIALRLGLTVEQLDPLAAAAAEPVRLGSFCTVFTKTEILSHLRRGAAVESIVRGAFISVVDRIVEMDPLEGEVVATGGVIAHNPTIVEIISERLGREVIVPEAPQFTGALGAALTARKVADQPEGKRT